MPPPPRRRQATTAGPVGRDDRRQRRPVVGSDATAAVREKGDNLHTASFCELIAVEYGLTGAVVKVPCAEIVAV